MRTESDRQSESETIMNIQNYGYLTMEKPHIEIVDQPSSKQLRFRYASDKRPVSVINNENGGSPTFRVNGYVGPATVRISCVSDTLGNLRYIEC